MLIDSHCHLDFAQFDSDRAEVIDRCAAAGVKGILVPGVEPASWPNLVALANQYPAINIALGVHPWYVDNVSLSDLETLQTWLNDKPDSVLAVGETGLDRLQPHWQKQVEFFEYQLTLAKKFGLPVIMHSVKSHSDILQRLKAAGQHRGVVHAYAGSYQQAVQLIDQGMKLGVGGTISYARASKTRDTFARVPLEVLVLETDAPDMPLQGQQGDRNTPENLPGIMQLLTELRSEPAEQIESQLLKNTVALFGDHWPMAVS